MTGGVLQIISHPVCRLLVRDTLVGQRDSFTYWKPAKFALRPCGKVSFRIHKTTKSRMNGCVSKTEKTNFELTVTLLLWMTMARTTTSPG